MRTNTTPCWALVLPGVKIKDKCCLKGDATSEYAVKRRQLLEEGKNCGNCMKAHSALNQRQSRGSVVGRIEVIPKPNKYKLKRDHI